jgi:hypothetical protein
MAGIYQMLSGMAASACVLMAGPALAQYAPVDPMPMGQAAVSVMANKISGDIADGDNASGSISGRCYDDSGPGPERRAMEAEYARRLGSSGRAGADRWRAEQGRAYRAQLIAAGKCPASVANGRRP